MVSRCDQFSIGATIAQDVRTSSIEGGLGRRLEGSILDSRLGVIRSPVAFFVPVSFSLTAAEISVEDDDPTNEHSGYG